MTTSTHRDLRIAFTILSVIVWITLSLPAMAFESKASRGNGVRVDVVPVKLAAGQAAQFKVRMNTHSVEIDQDLTAVSDLRDDQGRQYRPAKWEGSPPGGHHRKGVLSFPALESSARSVTLTIRDIAGVAERTFTWAVTP